MVVNQTPQPQKVELDIVSVEKVEKVDKKGKPYISYIVRVGNRAILWVKETDYSVSISSVAPIKVEEGGRYALIRYFSKF